ncbi:MAG: type II secretion system protein GspL [Aestuariibacter sp.]
MQHLVIRFSGSADEHIQWLAWSSEQNDIIASGELASHTELSTLSDRVNADQVIALVPACDVKLISLDLPAKASRKILQAIPYMLEDDVVGNVEQHFFALAERQGTQQQVLVVAHQKMQSWLDALQKAGLHCQKMLPDVLALPEPESDWFGIQLNDEVLVRTGTFSGFVAEVSWVSELMSVEAKTHEQPIVLSAGTDIDMVTVANVDKQLVPSVLPMQLLAENAIRCNVNLLQDRYKVKKQRSAATHQWRLAAILAGVAVLTTFIDKGIEASQLSSQTEQLQQQIVAEYKRAFPNARRIVNVRSQMSQKLTAMQQAGSGISMLAMLSQLESAFAQSDIKPQSMRFDKGRSEIRMQAVAGSYEALESFKRLAEQQGFTVEQGAINNRDEQVIGSLAIRS